MIIFGISKLEEKNVNKIVSIEILLLVFGSILCGTVAAAEESVSPGPNSESGDADPEGTQYGPGPAPNSGDGIPDGPGWE